MSNNFKKTLKNLITLIKERYKLIIFLLLAIIAVGYFFYNRNTKNQPDLVFENPVRKKLAKTIEISGFVDASEKAQMRFVAGGKVVFLGAKEGDRVKKWQTIATIDGRDLQNRLQRDLNAYLQERYDWDQQLDDIKDRTIDKKEQRSVDKNQLTLNNVVLDVEYRDIAITNTVLSSPFSGVLVSSPVSTAGINLSPSDIFEIVNPDSLVFKAFVDESDIAQVKIGQKAQIFLDAYDGLVLETVVKRIGYKSTTSTSGTAFIVEFDLIDPQITIEQALDKYRLGMNGDAEILIDEKADVLTIPLLAIREENDKIFVDVKVDEKTTEAREISIGLETDEEVEVLSGLTEDDLVLIP